MRLLVSAAGGEGHLRPLLPLARTAASIGHEVAVTGALALAGVAEADGLAFIPTRPDVVAQHVPLRPVDPEREDRAVREGFAGWMARERAAEVLALCTRWRPDVIVGDEMDFGTVVVAERLGIPHASVLVIAAGGFVRPALVAPALDRLRAEHGLPPDPDLAALSRYLVLSPFPPGYRDPADPLPATAHGFRASPVPRSGAGPAVVERLGGGPVVYVTLGTIFTTESGDLLSRVLAGVRELPVEVVVTVGRTRDPAELGPQPGTVHVEHYVDQSLLLPHCAAVVTHGGSGSVLGALAHGLPLVCLPMGADQPLNAARCTALAVGLALDVMTLTPHDARDATSAVLTDPGYRQAAGRLQAEIAALPPPSHAVALLERLATEQRPVLSG